MPAQGQSSLDESATKLRKLLPANGGPIASAIMQAVTLLDKEHHEDAARDLEAAMHSLAISDEIAEARVRAEASARLEVLEDGVPSHLRDGLFSFIRTGRPVGGFLTAVLTNDLSGCIRAADPISLRALAQTVRWLQRCAPSAAWGSVEHMRRWSELPQADRDAAMLALDLQ